MRQWGAMAFVCTELCIRKGSPDVLRAWAAIDERLEVWNMNALEKQGLGQKKQSLWFPIKRILEKAILVRLNDEFMRSQDKHITKAFLDDQNSVATTERPKPAWEMLDDFQIPERDSESTLFGPFDPSMPSDYWLTQNTSNSTDFSAPMPNPTGQNFNSNYLWPNL
jgi:hypothetical protein